MYTPHMIWAFMILTFKTIFLKELLKNLKLAYELNVDDSCKKLCNKFQVDSKNKYCMSPVG